MKANTGDELLPAEREPPKLDAAIVLALVCVGVAALFLVGGAWLLKGAGVALGVAIGGALALANLWLFARVGRGILTGGPRGRLWALIGALKVVTLLGGAWLLMRSGLATGLTLAIGYAALPAGVTVASLLRPPGPTSEPAGGGGRETDLVAAGPSSTADPSDSPAAKD